MPYQSSGRIADLLLRQGGIKAAAINEPADAWARGLQNLGQIAGGTIQDMIKGRRQETLEKRADEQYAHQQEAYEGEALENDAVAKATDPTTGHVDHAQVIQDLREHQLAKRATDYETKVRSDQDAYNNRSLARFGATKGVLAQGQAALASVQNSPNPTQTYSELYPSLVQMAEQVKPGLGAGIPQQYDQEKVNGILKQIADTDTELNASQRTLERLLAAQDPTKKLLDQQQGIRRAIGQGYKDATSKETWDAETARLKSLGVTDEQLQQFGEWTPASPAKAYYISLTQEERQALATGKGAGIGIRGNQSKEFNDYSAEYIKRQAANGGQELSPQQEAQLWQDVQDGKVGGGSTKKPTYTFADLLNQRNEERKAKGQAPLDSGEVIELQQRFEGRTDPYFKIDLEEYEALSEEDRGGLGFDAWRWANKSRGERPPRVATMTPPVVPKRGTPAPPAPATAVAAATPAAPAAAPPAAAAPAAAAAAATPAPPVAPPVAKPPRTGGTGVVVQIGNQSFWFPDQARANQAMEAWKQRSAPQNASQ